MQDEITIQGKKYKLVPVEEHSILEDYEIGAVAQRQEQRPVEAKTEGSSPSSPAGIKDAIPKISDYRERYKQRKVRLDEIRTQAKIIEPEDKTEGLLDGYEYKGESLFFGAGLQADNI